MINLGVVFFIFIFGISMQWRIIISWTRSLQMECWNNFYLFGVFSLQSFFLCANVVCWACLHLMFISLYIYTTIYLILFGFYIYFLVQTQMSSGFCCFFFLFNFWLDSFGCSFILDDFFFFTFNIYAFLCLYKWWLIILFSF